ncbi:regulator of cell cycle RGCC-like [Pelobates cultripes]|uniref:Regulator of cell cycle RGCC-like n=1 Tax=Pelobates cultripes TaxID=61616 RepID=A0AAD1T5H0_PELCU|nr:regulator of cell cycle RGCC-like [Pelobates cultripes]
MDRKVSLGEDLTLTLSEFDDALQDFSRGPRDSEDQLRQLKLQHLASCSNGNSDTDSGSSSVVGSLSASEESLNHSITSSKHQTNAKLGDTRELEDFIADLDKVLDDL